MYILVHLAVLAATVLVLARVVPGVHIRTNATAVIVAVVFSLLNYFLGWIVQVLLFIPALLTLGLLFLFMSFIVNTVMLWLTDKLLPSFELTTPRALFVSSAVITLVNAVFHTFYAWSLSTNYGQGPAPRWI